MANNCLQMKCELFSSLKNGLNNQLFVNFFLFHYIFLVNFGPVTDRQTDRKRLLTAHSALAHGGSKSGEETSLNDGYASGKPVLRHDSTGNLIQLHMSVDKD